MNEWNVLLKIGRLPPDRPVGPNAHGELELDRRRKPRESSRPRA